MHLLAKPSSCSFSSQRRSLRLLPAAVARAHVVRFARSTTLFGVLLIDVFCMYRGMRTGSWELSAPVACDQKSSLQHMRSALGVPWWSAVDAHRPFALLLLCASVHYWTFLMNQASLPDRTLCAYHLINSTVVGSEDYLCPVHKKDFIHDIIINLMKTASLLPL